MSLLKSLLNKLHPKEQPKPKKKWVRRIKDPMARAKEMAYLRRKKLSLQEIADKFGITRERVRQILIERFPGEEFPNCLIVPKITFKCTECGKDKEIYPSQAHAYRFCSKACAKANRLKVAIASHKPTNSRFAPIELRRAYWRIRTKKYYEEHSHEPRFKARIKINNEKGALRLKLKKQLQSE